MNASTFSGPFAAAIYLFRAACSAAARDGQPLPKWQEPTPPPRHAPLVKPESAPAPPAVKASAGKVRTIPVEALRFGGGTVTFHPEGTP